MTEARRQLKAVLTDFEKRHWQTRRVFMTRYEQIVTLLKLDLPDIGDEKRQLIGAYFCHEYSYAAAALMNPSVVPHPDQTGLRQGSIRILMSLRAVGEGHISSIAFREGLIGAGSSLKLAPEPPFATATDAPDIDGHHVSGPVTVYRNKDSTLSGTVIFPITPSQKNGLEDLRITHFTHDDGAQEYIGTYTAYSGREIQYELLRTVDFRTIDLVPMRGAAARNKGMALFPRKIDGRYMMIGRQDGQNLFLLKSDEIDRWEDGELHSLPQDVADMFGWPEYAPLVARAMQKLPPAERASVLLVGDNYGPTGACNWFNRAHHLGLPVCHTTNGSYSLWWPEPLSEPAALFYLMEDDGAPDVVPWFRSAEVVGTIRHPYARSHGGQVWLLRGPKPGFGAWARKQIAAARDGFEG